MIELRSTPLVILDWIVLVGGTIGTINALVAIARARRAGKPTETWVGITLAVMTLLAGPAAARLIDYAVPASLVILGVSAGLAVFGYGEWRKARRAAKR